MVLLPFSGGSDTLAGYRTAHSRSRHRRRPLQRLRRTRQDTVERASPALDYLLLIFPTFGYSLGFALSVTNFICLASSPP